MSSTWARVAQLRAEGRCACGAAETAEDRKLCEDCLAAQRLRKREVRAERRAAGLCLTCGGPRPCRRHRKPRKRRMDMTAYRDRKAAAGLCFVVGCNEPLAPRSAERCAHHHPAARRERMYAARRAWVQRQIEAGLCVQCAWPNPDPTRQRCPDCRELERERNTERACGYRAEGRCVCGRRPRPGFSRCAKCHARQQRLNDARVAARRAAGLCRCCPRPLDHPRSPFCADHRAAVRARVQRVRRVKRGLVFRHEA